MQRRRGTHLEAALLDAAWNELTERGYAGCTLESIAQRAGTSTPVLYRRWANKAAMIEAAVAHASARRALEIPDTGSLRGDLTAIMRAANDSRIDLLAASAVHLGSYFDTERTSPQQLRHVVLDGRSSAADLIFERAAQRGEVHASQLTPRVVSLPFDLFRHEVLTTLEPVSDEAILQIVDEIVLPLVATPVR